MSFSFFIFGFPKYINCTWDCLKTFETCCSISSSPSCSHLLWCFALCLLVLALCSSAFGFLWFLVLNLTPGFVYKLFLQSRLSVASCLPGPLLPPTALSYACHSKNEYVFADWFQQLKVLSCWLLAGFMGQSQGSAEWNWVTQLLNQQLGLWVAMFLVKIQSLCVIIKFLELRGSKQGTSYSPILPTQTFTLQMNMTAIGLDVSEFLLFCLPYPLSIFFWFFFFLTFRLI